MYDFKNLRFESFMEIYNSSLAEKYLNRAEAISQ